MTAILAERVDIVIGVDTHTDTHTAAVLTALGDLDLLFHEIDAVGFLGDAMLHLDARIHLHEVVVAVVVHQALDGARSHGIGLTRHLRAAGQTLIEAARIKGVTRRRGGKSDALDAIHVARTALAALHIATPRADGDREALRILTVCRRHYTDTRTATVNLLKSLILTADDELPQAFARRTVARTKVPTAVSPTR